MDVGIVTPRFPPNNEGGGEISSRLLARRLSSSAEIDSVTVYTFDGPASEGDDEYCINRYESPSVKSFEVINSYAYLKLRSKLEEDNIDIIHSYNMQLHPVVGHLSSKSGIPSVATLNSYSYIPYQKIGVQINNFLEWYKRLSWVTSGPILRDRMRHIDVFIAISSTVEEIYRDTMFPDERIKMIPNMCEPDLFTNVADGGNANIRSDSRTFKLLYIGSLRDTKGVEYLIRSAEYLPNEYQITIAGGGDNESKLRRLTDDLGVADQVTLLGYVAHEQIGELYNDADIFIHPGIWPEPFGRTIIEAMQMGLPVVATNIGGPAEVIPQEDCLCNPKDPRDLAKTIQYVSSSSRKIGEYNLKYVQEMYSPEKVLPDLIKLYRSVK